MTSFQLPFPGPPTWNGLFWTHCNRTGHSLTWLPPDYRRGECVYCKSVYHFPRPYGVENMDTTTRTPTPPLGV